MLIAAGIGALVSGAINYYGANKERQTALDEVKRTRSILQDNLITTEERRDRVSDISRQFNASNMNQANKLAVNTRGVEAGAYKAAATATLEANKFSAITDYGLAADESNIRTNQQIAGVQAPPDTRVDTTAAGMIQGVQTGMQLSTMLKYQDAIDAYQSSITQEPTSVTGAAPMTNYAPEATTTTAGGSFTPVSSNTSRISEIVNAGMTAGEYGNTPSNPAISQSDPTGIENTWLYNPNVDPIMQNQPKPNTLSNYMSKDEPSTSSDYLFGTGKPAMYGPKNDTFPKAVIMPESDSNIFDTEGYKQYEWLRKSRTPEGYSPLWGGL